MTTTSQKADAPLRKNDVAADASFLEAMPVLELHRSNVLRLETQELLKECRLDVQHVSWHAAAHHYIGTLNTLLGKMDNRVDCSPKACPLPLQADKPPTCMEIPKEVFIAWHGGGAVGITTKAGNAKQLPLLETSIALPNSIWNPKDYLHHRYFHKRNLILWHIIKYLDKHKTVGTVQWRFAHGNDQCPCIILTPPTATPQKKKKRKKQKTDADIPSMPKKVKFQIQISLHMESHQWIPPTRLFPNRCNLKNSRESAIYNHDLVKDVVAQDLLQDYLPPLLQDALVLLKVWALQRGFLEGHDSFGSVKEMAFLLLYLMRTKHVTARMAPLEIITVWFKFVSEMNDVALAMPLEDCTEARTIQDCQQAQLYAQQTKDSPLSDNDPPTLLECFKKFTNGPVLLDSTMMVNLWGRLSPSFVEHLQASAKASLECLHSSTTARPFSYLFLEEARFQTTMDCVMRIPLSHFKSPENFDGIARKVIRMLRKALGDRVRLIRVLTTGNGRITNVNPNQIPIYSVNDNVPSNVSPTGEDELVLGLTLNPETCHRVVDRGPPADDTEGTASFLELWGKQKAQLRRFKDGAIVHAVVWNTPDSGETRMENDDKTQGGIVERIVRHILKLHFFSKNCKPPQFALRNMLSLVDGVADESAQDNLLTNSTAAHRSVMNAFDLLSEFLRKNSSPTVPVPGSVETKTSRLGVPLAIDAVEPLSPSLRYSQLFPPVPHPCLGGPGGKGKVSGIAPPPVEIQIRFGASSKWPTDLKAMGAAKTGMLIQLAEGIENLRLELPRECDGFEGSIQVNPNYMDIGYKGYSWRILVRADPELHMLRKLQKPTPEAVLLLRDLTRKHVVSAMHHSMIHAIHTLHPSSGSVVRLAKRWTASHLLSDLIPFEAIELLVAKVYTNRDVPLDPPATVVCGFLRFLHLLASHDFARYPLVVDPHGHITEDDHASIWSQFEQVRGSEFNNGPPMYIISPNDRASNDDEAEMEKGESAAPIWTPSFTLHNPERVVLVRAAALAKRSHDFLSNALSSSGSTDLSVVFHETPSSFKSYSALLRVDSDFCFDSECSSTAGSSVSLRPSKADKSRLESSYTRSMRQRLLGPKALRRTVYRNLNVSEDDLVLHGWRPVSELVESLREKFGSLALFFYNDLGPEVIGMLWRPTSFVAQPFSVMNSEYACPMQAGDWKPDSMVVHNQNDVLREMSQYTDCIIQDVKVLDDRSIAAQTTTPKRSASASDEDDDSSSESE